MVNFLKTSIMEYNTETCSRDIYFSITLDDQFYCRQLKNALFPLLQSFDPTFRFINIKSGDSSRKSIDQCDCPLDVIDNGFNSLSHAKQNGFSIDISHQDYNGSNYDDDIVVSGKSDSEEITKDICSKTMQTCDRIGHKKTKMQ